jgi:hypothetical protein
MKKFEIGATYSMNSIYNHEVIWHFTVKARTAQYVTLAYGERESIRCRINKEISEYRGAESVFPLGRYSMAPILSADKIA